MSTLLNIHPIYEMSFNFGYGSKVKKYFLNFKIFFVKLENRMVRYGKQKWL